MTAKANVQASEKEKLLFRQHYTVIFNASDRILVNKLLDKIGPSISQMESFFGESPGGMVTIIITRSKQEYRSYLVGKVPEWSQAVAFIGERLIVVRLERAEAISRLPRIMAHELSHILIAEMAPAERIPVWLNEGIAEYLSGDALSLQDKITIANAMQTGSIPPLETLDSLLAFQNQRAQLAYAQARTAVDYFIEQHGVAKLQQLLHNIGYYPSVNDAFEQTVGYDFIDFEIKWYQDLHDRYRWLVFLNLENILWMSITFLFVMALIVIRRRNKRRIRHWEEEEDQYPEPPVIEP